MTSDTFASAHPARWQARMIEDMSVRGFQDRTRRDLWPRHVRAFAAFIGRSPDTATAEDPAICFQLHQDAERHAAPSTSTVRSRRCAFSSR